MGIKEICQLFSANYFLLFRCNTQKTLRQWHMHSTILSMTDLNVANNSVSDISHVDTTVVKTKSFDRGLFTSALTLLAIVFIVRWFVAAPYVVSGSSMEPNFHDWNYLIVDQLSYRFSSPARGDVIVLDLPQETSRALIKRVIGLPGETVVLSGTAPTVSIINAANPTGFTLTEPYIAPSNYGGASNARYTLGSDEYFVLGDNRRVSADSRLWGILPRTDIVGRVLLRLYPLTRMGILPEQAHYQ
jgi:signal peptidase I